MASNVWRNKEIKKRINKNFKIHVRVKKELMSQSCWFILNGTGHSKWRSYIVTILTFSSLPLIYYSTKVLYKTYNLYIFFKFAKSCPSAKIKEFSISGTNFTKLNILTYIRWMILRCTYPTGNESWSIITPSSVKVRTYEKISKHERDIHGQKMNFLKNIPIKFILAVDTRIKYLKLIEALLHIIFITNYLL